MKIKVTPFLWFDNNAGEAAKLYTKIFPDSKMLTKTEYDEKAPGTDVQVRIFEIEIAGQRMSLMNAGPIFKFNEAISFLIDCDGQQEVDYFWNALIADGGQESQCGWLKDKFGLSWQVVPKQLMQLLSNDKTGKVMKAMLGMKKIIVADLQKAAE
jgi:predicted 3-demethylubiquinone-9 3-methyltransferase (glyoxalase superfamily)